MIKRFVIFLLFAVMLHAGYAQNPDADSVLMIQDQPVDTPADENENYEEAEELFTDTIVNIHAISILPDTVNYWKNKKEFSYVKNLDSLLKALQEKQEASKENKVRLPNPSFLDNIFNAPFLKLILWTMAAIFVGVILFQLFKNNGFFKRADRVGVQEEAVLPDDDILEQNFDKLLQQAYNLGDFRLAIRYQFLKTLQRLRDKEWIEFSVDKTNSRYVHEVPAQWRNDFAKLILNYEYVWYGNFALTAAQYDLLQKKYTSFNEKI